MLELISQRPSVSQRELAETTGLSLGLINLTLKRLIKTGHIKVSALNRRKLEYLLTSKSIIELTNRTTNYIARTFETFSTYKTHIDDLLKELIDQGHNQFALLGRGEVSSIVELFLTKRFIKHRTIEDGEDILVGETVLDCRLRKEVGGVGISILERLLRLQTPAREKISKKLEVLEGVKK